MPKMKNERICNNLQIPRVGVEPQIKMKKKKCQRNSEYNNVISQNKSNTEQKFAIISRENVIRKWATIHGIMQAEVINDMEMRS